MNLIAIDIGNTNITIGLFLHGKEDSIQSVPGRAKTKLTNILTSAWQKIPYVKAANAKKRNGAIVVSSVKPVWTELVAHIARETLDEKILLIGKDIPAPIELAVEEPERVGSDRAVSAAAAYAVVENAVVIADFGTAVTIDVVDEKGRFLGGVICPGFELSARALETGTAQLPRVKVNRPKTPYGRNTREAISCGLYYAAVGTLQEVVRRYAEKLGRWPQTIITGRSAELIRKDCEFIDNFVPNLAVKGVVLAYKKYLEERAGG
jgi:type III pantothenate kinase